MRIFLVLLIATASFVVALLLGSLIASGRLGARLGTARRKVWLAGLIIPALGVEFACWRLSAHLNRDPRGWVAPTEAALATAVLLTAGLMYAAGYCLGGLPPRARPPD